MINLTPIQIFLGIITTVLFLAFVGFGRASHSATSPKQSTAEGIADMQAAVEKKPLPSIKKAQDKIFKYSALSIVCLFGAFLFSVLLGVAIKQSW